MAAIESLLDTDFYKFTMGQLVFRRHRAVPVRFTFTNRTADVRLGEVLDLPRLRQDLERVAELRFAPDELDYLRGIDLGAGPVFDAAYLDFLAGLRLPPATVEVEDGRLRLSFEGPWSEAIYWETLALSTVNEHYFAAVLARGTDRDGRPVPSDPLATGRRRLEEKVEVLRRHPSITFAEFGTRRRFGRAWHDEVVRTLAAGLPEQMLGSSNVALARAHGLRPIGTFAHELYMVMSGIHHGSDAAIRGSHNLVLEEWWETYGAPLSIALTDTYGSRFFFADMTAEQARRWRGLRHDSGDAIAFGERAIDFYASHDIDPVDKLVVFSDGLDLDEILRIHGALAGRVGLSYGWGTNLTNDVGLAPLSLVVKATEAAGHGTVKLSDNLAKATGRPEDVERFKRIFGHTVTHRQGCTY